MLDCYNRFKPPLDKETATSLLKWAILYGSEEDVDYIFKEMNTKEGTKPDTITYNTLLQYYSTKRSTKKLFQITQKMEQHNIKKDIVTYNLFIKHFAMLGKKKEAMLQLEELLNNELPDLTTFYWLLEYFGQKESQLRYLLDLMESYNIKNNITTYNTIIKCFRALGNEIEMLQQLENMKKNNISPNEVTFSLLMNYYVGKRGTRIIELQTEMEKCNVRRSILTQNLLLNHFAIIGDEAQMLECFQQMKDDNITPTHATFSFLLKFYAGKSEEKFLDLLHQMKEFAIQPDEEINAIVLDHYTAMRNEEQVLHCLDQMKLKYEYPDEYLFEKFLKYYTNKLD
jgi:pentatricopeptide repeat domain-containing protein 1